MVNAYPSLIDRKSSGVSVKGACPVDGDKAEGCDRIGETSICPSPGMPFTFLRSWVPCRGIHYGSGPLGLGPLVGLVYRESKGVP